MKGRLLLVSALTFVVPARAAAAEPPIAEEPRPRWVPPVVHATLLFTTLRATEAWLWPYPFAQTDPRFLADRYREAWTRPPLFDARRPLLEWDGDAWYLNGIGHGAMGSELYLRARLCGFGAAGSLAWATATSGVWEYVFEANGVRPSALDLVWTPLAGMVFGELRHALYRAAGGVADRTLRTFVRGVVDPFGALEHAVTGSACAR